MDDFEARHASLEARRMHDLAVLKSLAEAGAHADERPRTFAGTGPDRPATPSHPRHGEGGVPGDPLLALRQALEQLRESGRLGEARSLLQEFLVASDGPQEDDEISRGKSSLFDPRMESRLREAFRDLHSGPTALEAAQARIRKDKRILAEMNRGLRESESPERRLLRSIVPDPFHQGGRGP
jgi:hypothetical protein